MTVESIYDFSTDNAANSFTVPDGFPEGMTFAQVHESFRELMAKTAAFYQDALAVNDNATFQSSTGIFEIVPAQTFSQTGLFNGLLFTIRLANVSEGFGPGLIIKLAVQGLTGSGYLVHPNGSYVAAHALDTRPITVLYYDGFWWLLNQLEAVAAASGIKRRITYNVTLTTRTFSLKDVASILLFNATANQTFILSANWKDFWPIGAPIIAFKIDNTRVDISRSSSPSTTIYLNDGIAPSSATNIYEIIPTRLTTVPVPATNATGSSAITIGTTQASIASVVMYRESDDAIRVITLSPKYAY